MQRMIATPFFGKVFSIKLPGRLSGSSKMRFKDIFSAIIYLLKISFKNIFI